MLADQLTEGRARGRGDRAAPDAVRALLGSRGASSRRGRRSIACRRSIRPVKPREGSASTSRSNDLIFLDLDERRSRSNAIIAKRATPGLDIIHTGEYHEAARRRARRRRAGRTRVRPSLEPPAPEPELLDTPAPSRRGPRHADHRAGGARWRHARGRVRARGSTRRACRSARLGSRPRRSTPTTRSSRARLPSRWIRHIDRRLRAELRRRADVARHSDVGRRAAGRRALARRCSTSDAAERARRDARPYAGRPAAHRPRTSSTAPPADRRRRGELPRRRRSMERRGRSIGGDLPLIMPDGRRRGRRRASRADDIPLMDLDAPRRPARRWRASPARADRSSPTIDVPRARATPRCRAGQRASVDPDASSSAVDESAVRRRRRAPARGAGGLAHDRGRASVELLRALVDAEPDDHVLRRQLGEACSSRAIASGGLRGARDGDDRLRARATTATPPRRSPTRSCGSTRSPSVTTRSASSTPSARTSADG